MRLTSAAGRVALAATLAGCAMSGAKGGSSTGSVRASEDLLTQRRVVASGIEVAATRWSAGLVDAAGGDPRLADVYLSGTTFTVTIQLEDRLPELPDPDLLTARGWSFGLRPDGGDVLAPREVRLLLVDRFPTAGGRHHHRLAFAVQFPAVDAQQVELQVRMKQRQQGRYPAGWWLTHRGATLRWPLPRE